MDPSADRVGREPEESRRPGPEAQQTKLSVYYTYTHIEHTHTHTHLQNQFKVPLILAPVTFKETYTRLRRA